MCIISDNIKFCSCVDGDIDLNKLKHYLVLILIQKKNKAIVFGETRISEYGITHNYIENRLKIATALEDKNTFDKPITFKEKDRLKIRLNNNSKNRMDVMNFQFKYTSGKWVYINDGDTFFGLNTLKEVGSGEIKEKE